MVMEPNMGILVVEDFELLRRLIFNKLKNELHLNNILGAADGEEGARLAEELKPDLVILDVGLPKLNGLQVAERISKSTPNSVILFVSQECSEEVVEEAFRVGGAGYVLKIDMETELATAIAKVLRGEKYLSRSLAGSEVASLFRSSSPV
jgi:DNA-binding NarL/FixJ family response regulator